MDIDLLKESAINPNSLVGKPLVVYIDGERRQIGTITKAQIIDENLYVAAELDLDNIDSASIEGQIFKVIHDA